MPRATPVLTPNSFNSFGDLLHHLRRRARLTQTELGIAVGYSNGQISRLEQNRRLPDQATLTALFMPALQLEGERDWANRLLQLASEARRQSVENEATPTPDEPTVECMAVESIPRPAPYEVERPQLQAKIQARLTSERCVALCAVGGMGKTTLTAAVARARAETAPVFWITLTSGVNTAVDAIVQQVASFLCAQGQTQVLPLLRTADTALPFNQQIVLLGSALNALSASATALPLLCFDNIHLVQNDSTVIQMLKHLVASTPALFLFTSREEVPLPEVAHIQLNGLQETEGAHLIERLTVARAASSPLDPLLAAHLLDKTGGSPMLLRLALGHLLDQPTDLANFVTQLETQPQVASYLLETVQRQLSAEAWHLLTQISVFRQEVNLYDPVLIDLIQAADGPYDLGPALSELQHRQLIDHPAQAKLHPLIRDYVYATLAADPVRRRRLHLVAAEWAERSQGDSLRAARHHTQAGQTEQVVKLLEGAEPTLIRQGQALTAVSVVESAIVQARHQRPLQAEVLRRLLAMRGQLLIGSLRQNEAQLDYEEALTLTDDPSVRAELVYRLSLMLSLKGQHSQALELINATKSALAPTETALLAPLMAVQGQALFRLARYDESREAIKQALRLSAQISQPISHEVQARAYYVLGDLYRVHGDSANALDCWQKSTEAARQAKHLRLESASLVCIGGLRYDQGDLAESWRIRTEALTVAQYIGHAYLEAYAFLHLADIHHDRCEFDEEIEKLVRAKELLLQVGDAVSVANADNQRAVALLTQGNLAEAGAVLEPLLTAKLEGIVPRLHAQYRSTHARLQALAGHADLAETELREALALPGISGMPVIHDWLTNYLVVVLLAQDKLNEAQTALAQMSAQPENVWMELQRQLATATVALAKGDRAAASDLCEAVDLRAQATGHELFGRQVDRLEEMLAHPAPLSSLPQRMWVMDEKLIAQPLHVPVLVEPHL
jgi:ATP/maltotriose-dependent transcriptional regulator MalT/transcriptional regulator with XRE-family HTH domain